MPDQLFALKRFTKTIATNTRERIYFGQANYILLLSNTGAADTLTISVDGQEFQVLPVGIKIITETKFEYVDILNTDSGNTTYVIYIGNGNIDNSALTLSTVIDVDSSATSHATPAAVTVTTTAAELIAASSTRREAIISNNGTAGEIVYIGDANVSAAAGRGIPIANGEKIILATQGAIWADAVSGTPSVSYMTLSGS